MVNKLKVAITGASGMLGTALIDCLSEENLIFANSRNEGYCKPGINWQLFDLLEKEKLVNWLEMVRPDVVIHCAAMVDVDFCEKNFNKAYALHVQTTEMISATVAKWNGKFIYISTDAVFDGKKQGKYNELDLANPPSVYGRTKYEGEQAALMNNNAIVLRTTIFGWSRIERCSFAEWILKGLVEQRPLHMFADVHFTPIYVMHVAEIVSKILKTDINGVYHLTGDSVLSKYQFAIEMAKQFGFESDNIIATSVDDSNLVAVRSKNMVLSNTKLADILGFRMPGVEDGIAYLKQQYDNGWLGLIKGRVLRDRYLFLEEL